MSDDYYPPLTVNGPSYPPPADENVARVVKAVGHPTGDSRVWWSPSLGDHVLPNHASFYAARSGEHVRGLPEDAEQMVPASSTDFNALIVENRRDVIRELTALRGVADAARALLLSNGDDEDWVPLRVALHELDGPS